MTNDEHQEQAPQYRPFWRRKRIRVVIGVLVAATAFFWWCQRVPLPTDEEMIAYLNAHRAEFEELIRRNRTFNEREHWPELPWPDQEKGTPELMRQAGISSINCLSFLYWLPDPYSPATAQLVKVMKDACDADWKQWHAMDGPKKNLPGPKCRLFQYQYGGLEVVPKAHYGNRHGSWRYGTVWKTYLHFPEPPRIEDGYLLGPLEADGSYGYKKTTASNLNYFPLFWREYGCVYKPIDGHWYLRLCNGH